MGLRLEYSDSFKDDLKRLDFKDAQAVLFYLNREIGVREDPRSVGLKRGYYWRYKTNGLLVTVKIVDEESKIVVVNVTPAL